MKNIGKGVFNLENFGFFFGNGVRKKKQTCFHKTSRKVKFIRKENN